tara:strand:- start:160 stop:303 length:144 start_codon:yes stop_codon:yes gene_type:complete
MIVLKLLNIDKFYGVSETIEIAKGKNKIPLSFKEGYKQIKRNRKWQK